MSSEAQPILPPRQGANVEYVDQSELSETFADSIQSIYFDGQSLRINFCVTRLNEFKANQTPSGKRYPSCRLVLSVGAAVDLMNHMRQISTALAQAGTIKAPAEPTTGKTN